MVYRAKVILLTDLPMDPRLFEPTMKASQRNQGKTPWTNLKRCVTWPYSGRPITSKSSSDTIANKCVVGRSTLAT